MTTYAWPGPANTPGWEVNHFELRIKPNVKVFTGHYTPATQAVDLLGERWSAVVHLSPTTSQLYAGRREAFFDRLKGPANWLSLWHLKRPAPLGTMRGSPTLSAAAAQLANTAAVYGSGTLLAGDMIGIGGQLVRVMADVTLPGTVEFQPRLRAAMVSGTAVTWDKPAANFILTADGVPVVYTPGMVGESALELIEAW